jgi:hypothetical protein
MEFTPRGKNIEIVEQAMEHIKSVPYRVSLRWLFYRLLQDGLYSTKDDYKLEWVGLASRLRKNFYGEWKPTTLRDDTSGMIERVGFFADQGHLKENPDMVADMINITFDPFYEMDRYTIIGFEARAMVEQFEYYTEGINLLPFGGDAHIEPKWNIAKHLEDAHRWYGKPLQFLYFGDYDNKGEKILAAAMKDIQAWCKYPIDFEWCGLSKEQAEKFNLPPNPDKAGQFQWEALTDPQAKEIISSAMAHNGVDTEFIKAKIQEGETITKEWQEKVKILMTVGV